MIKFRFVPIRFLTILLAVLTSLATAQAGFFTVNINSFQKGVNGGSDSVVLTDHIVFPILIDAWSASSSSTWVTWNTNSGLGSATVNFTFTNNPGPGSRVGNLTIGGLPITVTQAGPTYVLGMSNLVVGPLAGTDGVVLTVNPGFGVWSVANTNSWLHPVITSGKGSSNVVFNFDANAGSTRTGNLSIGGQILTVTQLGNSYLTAGPVTLVSGLNFPYGVAVDGAKNVYIADTGNDAIKKWNVASNTMTTLVSSGINHPYGLAVDMSGNVYMAIVILTGGNQAIKRWNASDSTVTSLISSGLSSPLGVAVDGMGNIYIDDNHDNTIKKWTTANSNLTTIVSGLNNPGGVAVDVNGNVYIADTFNSAVKRWNVSDNTLTNLVSSGLLNPRGVAVDATGSVYITDTDHGAVKKWNAFTGAVTTLASSGFDYAFGIAIDVNENVYVSERNSGVIMELPKAFLVTTTRYESSLAGNDSLPPIIPSTINLTGPFQPTSDQSWLTITSTNNGVVSYSFTANSGATNRIAHISLLGQSVSITQLPALSLGTSSLTEGPNAATDTVVLAAASPSTPWTASANAAWLHVAAPSGSGSTNLAFTMDANTGTTRTGTIAAGGQTLTVTQAGAGYVATGQPTAIGGLFFSTYSGSAGGVAVDASGKVYAPDYDGGVLRMWTPGTNANVALSIQRPDGSSINPSSLAIDATGSLIILDTDAGFIERWNPSSGILNVLVGSGIGLANFVSSWAQLAVDASGNVYLADAVNNAVEKYVAATGAWVTNVSGLNQPYGIAVDLAGNLYIADTYNNAVKSWRADSGTIIPLVTANLNHPRAVAVDGSGNVYIADTGNNALKKWTAATGTVTTLAANLTNVNGVTLDSLANIYVSLPQTTPVVKLPVAFVNTTTRYESAAGGVDSLPPVLPITENLLLPFVPGVDSRGDTKWVTNFTVTNGVISVFMASNNSAGFRTNLVIVLGATNTLIQNWAVAAPAKLQNPSLIGGGGGVVIGFTNYPGATFTLWSTTNLSVPFTNWIREGTPSNTTGNQFQFTDTKSTNSPQKFYRVTSP